MFLSKSQPIFAKLLQRLDSKCKKEGNVIAGPRPPCPPVSVGGEGQGGGGDQDTGD